MSFEIFNIKNIEDQKENGEKNKYIEDVKNIHRGVWANKLNHNQELPVGGFMFDKELSVKLTLDFNYFDKNFNSLTKEKIKASYEQNKDNLIEWLKKTNSNIDPYTYFVCYHVQKKTQELLNISSDKPTDSDERMSVYKEKKSPKFSELIGKTECVERAALGQYLLQKIDIKSSYVSGVAMQDVEDKDEFPEDHSFIVLDHPTEEKKSLIFDIARPLSQYNIPRVLETDCDFTYELIKNKEEIFIGAKEVLQGCRLWFGVGEPVAGQHKRINEKGG